MTRVILSVLGIVLALWVGFQMLGWLVGVVKFFALIAVLAVVAYFVVSLIARGSKKSSGWR
jgi:hypothetical protein